MITVKQGDTRHAVSATLSYNGTPEDLTGCTVHFSMSNGVTGVAQVIDAPNGKVMYPLQAENVDTVGMFEGEFKVTYPDNRESRYPNDKYIKIKVLKNLG